jgi:hypothetical protein
MHDMLPGTQYGISPMTPMPLCKNSSDKQPLLAACNIQSFADQNPCLWNFSDARAVYPYEHITVHLPPNYQSRMHIAATSDAPSSQPDPSHPGSCDCNSSLNTQSPGTSVHFRHHQETFRTSTP